MRKSIWEMLGEFLREVALVVLAVGFLDQLFSDQGITAGAALAVLGAGFLLWISGAWMERNRKE